jgi:hypothetical protein
MGVPVTGITPFAELAETVAGVTADTGKPVVLVLPDLKRGSDDLDVSGMMAEAREAFVAQSIPVFGEIGEALRAVGHVNTYYGRKHEH